MNRSSFSFIKENEDAYAKCHEILGLPEGVDWSKLQVSFGSGEFAEVTLVLIPSGEQVRDLAELAIQQLQDNCTVPVKVFDFHPELIPIWPPKGSALDKGWKHVGCEHELTVEVHETYENGDRRGHLICPEHGFISAFSHLASEDLKPYLEPDA